MNALLEAALQYRRRGWSIFPIGAPDHKDPDKRGRPLVTWSEFQTRLASENEIRAWWARWPRASIGLVCGRVSKVIVIDVDPRNGGTLEGLPRPGRVVRSGGGGHHYYYGYPFGIDEDDHIKSINHSPKTTDDPIKLGRDIKADGGIVVLPPSMHKSGGQYTWESEEERYPAPPEWAINVSTVDAPRTTSESDHWLAKLIAEGPKAGERNTSTAKYAGYLASKGHPIDVAIEMIHKWLEACNVDREDFSDAEIKRTVESVYRAEKEKQKRAKTAKEKKPRPEGEELFRVLRFDAYMEEFGAQEPKWIVKDWLPESTVGFVVSEPGGFKSWITYDLANAIAGGYKFLGQFPVRKRGPVLLVQQEDFTAQTAERNALIVTAQGGHAPPRVGQGGYLFDCPKLPEDHPVYFHPDRRLKVGDPEVMDEVERIVAKLRPVLLVIDPLYAAVDLDEFMLKAIPQIDRFKDWRDRYGTSVLLVHHTTKANEWGRAAAWGTTFLNAFSETLLHIRRPEDQQSTYCRRYFKISPPLPYVRIDFDIAVPEYRYRPTVQEVTREEAESAVSSKSKGGQQKEHRSPVSTVSTALAENGGYMEPSEISLMCGLAIEEVEKALKTLLRRGDVRRRGKTFTHAVPDLS